MFYIIKKMDPVQAEVITGLKLYYIYLRFNICIHAISCGLKSVRFGQFLREIC